MFTKKFRFAEQTTTENCRRLAPTTDGDPRMFVANGGWLIDSGHPDTPTDAVILASSVPEDGNYKVTVTLQTAVAGGELTLFTNRREVIADTITLAPGVSQTFTHWVHIAPYGNEVGGVALDDRRVYLSLIGRGASQVTVTATITSVQVPTLHIIGDSITTDDEAYLPYHPQATWSGWGQHVGQFLADIAVDDQAHNGMTTACYRADGHWQRVLADCRAGDFVLMQFGHNDQKRTYLQPFGTYATNLRRFVREAEEAGAIPILVSPLSRIPTRDANGTWFDTLTPFAEATKLVATEVAVDFIDLHATAFAKLLALSQPTRYFMDAAHTNDYGADMVASWVLQEAVATKLTLAPMIKSQAMAFQPRQAETIDKLLDNEQPVVKAAPVKNVYADGQDLSTADQAVVLAALRRHVLDPCVGQLHPHAPLAIGMALYAFAAIAKPFDRRPYQGLFVDVSAHEWLAPYVQAALDAKLWQPADFDGDQCFLQRTLTGRMLCTLTVRNALPKSQRDLTPQACEQQARQWGWLWPGYVSDGPVTRLQAYTVMMKED